jgi:uncharacterized protein (UPF0210 family)
MSPRRTLAGAMAVVAMFALLGGVAAARGLTVTQAVRAQDKLVRDSPGYKTLQDFRTITTATQAEQAIPGLNALEKLLAHAANTIANASAGASQKTGQKDCVSGVRLFNNAVGMFVIALTDSAQGKSSAAKTEATKAFKLIRSGNMIGIKGEKLLHLTKSG